MLLNPKDTLKLAMGQEETGVMESSHMTSSVSSKYTDSCSSQDQVREKMEAMQKRINELKEKVKYEGELLTNEEQSITLVNPENQEHSLTDLEKCDGSSQEKSDPSDTSLYFSASNFSFGSINSDFSDSTQDNFSKFINKFVRNQNYQERLSLLQLHSSKQISMNMMRRSLAELDTRCIRELEVIEKSLQHLKKLAVEINRSSGDNQTDLEEHHKNSGRNKKSRTEEFLLNSYDSETANCDENTDSKTVDVYNKNSIKIRKSKTTSILWAPLERKSKFEIDWKKNPAFLKPSNEEILKQVTPSYDL